MSSMGLSRRMWKGLAAPVLLIAVAAFASPALAQSAAQEVESAARQTGNAITDSWITMKVHSQFIPEDALEGSDIDVDTSKGVVTLNGTVATEAGRARAIAIAKATDGVTSVTDKLRVGISESVTPAARDAGRKAGEETKEAGRTAAGATREAGRDAARTAKDATGTTGRAVTDGWIKSKIYSQYLIEGALNDSDIDIDISKGVVSLNGVVRSEAGRARALAIAKETDGVKSVNSNLKITPKAK
ncbi:MAG TPA: BON domain-containing protein [Egibacteraceae bacterium]|nr:BON domain-containing protein [Egibacteraceae bacterium]